MTTYSYSNKNTTAFTATNKDSTSYTTPSKNLTSYFTSSKNTTSYTSSFLGDGFILTEANDVILMENGQPILLEANNLIVYTYPTKN